MKRNRTVRRLLSLLLLLAAFPARAQIAPDVVTVDFEDHVAGVSPIFNLEGNVTEGLATFSGGQLIRNTTNQTFNFSTMYGTGASRCCIPSNSGLTPAININFDEAVS